MQYFSRKHRIHGCIALALLLALTGYWQWRGRDAASSAASLTPADAATSARLHEAYSKLPLGFETNRGQAGEGVRFLSRGAGYSLLLKSNGAALTMRTGEKSASIGLKFLGANPAPKIEGVEEQPGKSNYLIGNDPSKWRTDVANFAKVRYAAVYPGIDLVFYGDQQRLEYDLILKPGADPSAIDLEFEGARQIRVDGEGDLLLQTATSELRQVRPVVYQEADGERRQVAGEYAIRGRRVAGFKIGVYDKTKPLVIDPVIAYSTRGIGGALIAVDAAGNAYVTGTTASLDFPNVNPLQNKVAGSEDVFIAKLNASGTALAYSTYLGGNGSDRGHAIAVDAAGAAYITGSSGSNDFPGATGSKVGRVLFKTVNGATNWSASDAGLPAATIQHVLVDPKTPATIFVGTEHLSSRARVYKTTDGGGTWAAADAGLSDSLQLRALVMNPINPQTLYALDANRKMFKTINGGVNWEAVTTEPTFLGASVIAIDPVNPMRIYAMNFLNFIYKSTNGGASWSLVPNNLDSSAGGTAFLVVDPSNPNTLYAASDSGTGVFKSVDGGANWNSINAGLPSQSGFYIESLTIDPKNSATVYVTMGVGKGIFKSVNGGGLWTPINNGLPAQGSSPAFSSTRIVVDPANSSTLYAAINSGPPSSGVYKSVDGGGNWSRLAEGLGAGRIASLAIDPATPATLYAGLGQPAADAFVAKVNAAGSALAYSAFIGGSGMDYGTDLAVDAARNAYVVGVTQSSDFSVSAGAFQRVLNGDGRLTSPDNFLTRLNANGAITYSTYFGGKELEGVTDPAATEQAAARVAVDRLGKVFVGGATNSRDFPLKNALQTTVAGGFIAKFDPDQSGAASLLFSTYLGVPNAAFPFRPAGAVNDIAVDSDGAVYVLGRGEIVTTPGAFQRGFGGTYLAKLNPGGTAFVYATQIGGDTFSSPGVGLIVIESFNGLALDAMGNAFLTGFSTRPIPVTPNAIQPVIGGGSPGKCGGPRGSMIPCSDGFVMKLNAAGSTLLYSSYLGGDLSDSAGGIAVDATGNIYITGATSSANFITTASAFESPFLEKFITKIVAGPGDKTGSPSTHVSAASFVYPAPLAPESIVSAFGSNLATTTAAATSLPLPTQLAGTTVLVDGRPAPLFFVSPGQINYQIPPETFAPFPNTVAIVSADGSFSVSMIATSPVSPGVFAADASGRGLAAAIALRIKADGSQSYEPVVRFDSNTNKFVAVPIDLGPETDQVFLTLFGTGWRLRRSETAFKVTIGGPAGSVDAPVLYAGAQPTLTGLDQINARLPRTLAGKGEVDVVVTVDGKAANTVRVHVK